MNLTTIEARLLSVDTIEEVKRLQGASIAYKDILTYPAGELEVIEEREKEAANARRGTEE